MFKIARKEKPSIVPTVAPTDEEENNRVVEELARRYFKNPQEVDYALIRVILRRGINIGIERSLRTI